MQPLFHFSFSLYELFAVDDFAGVAPFLSFLQFLNYAVILLIFICFWAGEAVINSLKAKLLSILDLLCYSGVIKGQFCGCWSSGLPRKPVLVALVSTSRLGLLLLVLILAIEEPLLDILVVNACIHHTIPSSLEN